MEKKNSFPLALEPPQGQVVIIDESVLRKAFRASRESPRRRIILPFHEKNEDPLQRMLNALQPGSYVRPHRHLSPPKSEPIVLLRGAVQVLIFSESGEVEQRIDLAAGGDKVGVDIRPGVFHCFIALEKDTVLFEVKPGPYKAINDKDFATWAPEEGSPEAEAYLLGLMKGR